MHAVGSVTHSVTRIFRVIYFAIQEGLVFKISEAFERYRLAEINDLRGRVTADISKKVKELAKEGSKVAVRIVQGREISESEDGSTLPKGPIDYRVHIYVLEKGGEGNRVLHHHLRDYKAYYHWLGRVEVSSESPGLGKMPNIEFPVYPPNLLISTQFCDEGVMGDVPVLLKDSEVTWVKGAQLGEAAAASLYQEEVKRLKENYPAWDFVVVHNGVEYPLESYELFEGVSFPIEMKTFAISPDAQLLRGHITISADQKVVSKGNVSEIGMYSDSHYILESVEGVPEQLLMSRNWLFEREARALDDPVCSKYLTYHSAEVAYALWVMDQFGLALNNVVANGESYTITLEDENKKSVQKTFKTYSPGVFKAALSALYPHSASSRSRVRNSRLKAQSYHYTVTATVIPKNRSHPNLTAFKIEMKRACAEGEYSLTMSLLEKKASYLKRGELEKVLVAHSDEVGCAERK